MSNNQFGLTGVGKKIQLGKRGNKVVTTSNAVEFRSSEEDDLVIIRAAPAVSNTDVVTLEQLNDSVVEDGYEIVMGDPSKGDGSYEGAVPLTSNTSISNAVDQLNTMLGILLPAAPLPFPSGITLSVTSTGSTPFLASGVANNSGGTVAAGTAVIRIVTAGVNTNVIANTGPATTGTISLQVNGTTVGSRVLTGNDVGTYSSLVLSNQNDYPVDKPGFWKSINVQATNAASALGINKIRITHSGAGNTNEVFYVRDNMTSVPTVTTASLVETNANISNSSGIPHYTTGSQFTANMSFINLSGNTYYGGNDPFSLSASNAAITAKTITYAGAGIAVPIAANQTGPTSITPLTVTLDGNNTHNFETLNIRVRNVNGQSTVTPLTTNKLLVKMGSAGVRIDENSVPVTNLGTLPVSTPAARVTTGPTDTPDVEHDMWDSDLPLSSFEASVVGGAIRHDQTNYSTGHMPVGPNLSVGRSGAQYVTFMFRRTALSKFKINVTGTYSGCWVKLPEVSNTPNSPNGWWNAFRQYDGAGVPGEVGDVNAGCAETTVMAGASGSYSITFGTESSTNSLNNVILVRFRLAAGQTITALSFSN